LRHGNAGGWSGPTWAGRLSWTASPLGLGGSILGSDVTWAFHLGSAVRHGLTCAAAVSFRLASGSAIGSGLISLSGLRIGLACGSAIRSGLVCFANHFKKMQILQFAASSTMIQMKLMKVNSNVKK
jgi:hypothetical protein